MCDKTADWRIVLLWSLLMITRTCFEQEFSEVVWVCLCMYAHQRECVFIHACVSDFLHCGCVCVCVCVCVCAVPESHRGTALTHSLRPTPHPSSTGLWCPEDTQTHTHIQKAIMAYIRRKQNQALFSIPSSYILPSSITPSLSHHLREACSQLAKGGEWIPVVRIKKYYN